MGKVTFIEFSGTSHIVEAKDGESLMQAAVGNLVPGITADCGGACACATCHVYVDAAWSGRVGGPSEIESAMLDVVTVREGNSRLSCQIKMRGELEGLVLRLPESQA